MPEITHEYLRANLRKQGLKEYNCGQQVVTALTNVSPQMVSEMIKNFKGTTVEEITRALNCFGFACLSTEIKLFSSRKSLNHCLTVLPKLCLLNIQNKHWSLYYDGIIYDACNGIGAFNDFHRFRKRIYGFIELHNI